MVWSSCRCSSWVVWGLVYLDNDGRRRVRRRHDWHTWPGRLGSSPWELARALDSPQSPVARRLDHVHRVTIIWPVGVSPLCVVAYAVAGLGSFTSSRVLGFQLMQLGKAVVAVGSLWSGSSSPASFPPVKTGGRRSALSLVDIS